MKICTKCGKTKPSEDFPPAKQNRDGRSSWCRQCTNDQRKQRYQNDPAYKERNKARARNHYQEDPDYQERHKAAMRERSKKLTETGARRTDSQRKKWQRWGKQRRADPKRGASLRAWKRNNHRDRYESSVTWREQERQRSKKKRQQLVSTPEGLRRWRDYKRRSEHVRRARRRDAGTYTNAEWNELCARYNHRCLCCGESRPLTVDHVIPLSRGGSNTIENLQPLCLSCNDRKGSRTIDYRTVYEGEL